MGKPSISTQLKTISKIISQEKNAKDLLESHRRILQIQQEIDEMPNKGTQKCPDLATIASWQKDALRTKKPIIHFLQPSIFDQKALFSKFKKIVKNIAETHVTSQGLRNLLSLTQTGKVNLAKLIEATLTEDAASIKNHADELRIHPALLLFAVSALIQPCLEEIARTTEASLWDTWWQTFCPVCGRIPVTARVRSGKRYLVCTFCGTEYLSDRILCVHCNNADPYTLKYLVAEDQPGFQIDFCKKCQHYVKVIDEGKIREQIPNGLEDMLTFNLDLAAKNRGLVRD